MPRMSSTIPLWCFLLLALFSRAQTAETDELQAEILQDLRKFNTELRQEVTHLKKAMREWQAEISTQISLIHLRVDGAPKNDSDLEARVSVLEESVSDLEVGFVILTDEVDDVESVNILQDQELNILEAEVFDNQNDIEALVDTTTGLQFQVSELEDDVTGLDQRVTDIESGGGGGVNVTDLTERVDALEEVTSELETENNQQDERISSAESDIGDLDGRVEDLESGGGGNWNNSVYHKSIFLAALSADESWIQSPVIFDRAEINPGGHYNTSTGVYTVPYDGIYQFSVYVAQVYDEGEVSVEVWVDGSVTGSHNDDNTNPPPSFRSLTLLLELTSGQTVHVRQWDVGGAHGCTDSLCSYFTGHLISAN